MNSVKRTLCSSRKGQPSVLRLAARLALYMLVCGCIAGSHLPTQAAGGLLQNQINGNGVEWQYLSIPAAAFHPKDSSLDYINYGSALYFPDWVVDAEFYASVELPQGSVIHEITVFYMPFTDLEYADLYFY